MAHQVPSRDPSSGHGNPGLPSTARPKTPAALLATPPTERPKPAYPSPQPPCPSLGTLFTTSGTFPHSAIFSRRTPPRVPSSTSPRNPPSTPPISPSGPSSSLETPPPPSTK